jgi:hypothetical protein
MKTFAIGLIDPLTKTWGKTEFITAKNIHEARFKATNKYLKQKFKFLIKKDL